MNFRATLLGLAGGLVLAASLVRLLDCCVLSAEPAAARPDVVLPVIACRGTDPYQAAAHDRQVTVVLQRKWDAVLSDAEIEACFGPQYRQIVGLLHEIEKQTATFRTIGNRAYERSHLLGLLTVIFGVISSALVTLSSTLKTEELPLAPGLKERLSNLGSWLKIGAVTSTIVLSLLAGLQNFYKPVETMTWAFEAKEGLDRLHTDIDRFLLAAAVNEAKAPSYWSLFATPPPSRAIDVKQIALWQERFDQVLTSANKAINERNKKGS